MIDIFHFPVIYPYLLEDGAKLIGLISWFVYFFRTSEYAVRWSNGNTSIDRA